MSRFFSFFSLKHEAAQDNLSSAARKIELHRRDLEMLKGKLETRRQALFEAIVRCVTKKDDVNASVYSSEHAELIKVIRAVSASEVALTQVALRFESIRDVGEAILHVNSVSKVLKEIGYNMSKLGPSLEHATDEVNTVLGETLAELGTLSPSVRLDVQTLSVEELIAKARSYAEQKATELKESFASRTDHAAAQDVLKEARRVALLADGTEVPASYPQAEPYLPQASKRIEERVYRYLASAGSGDAAEACTELGVSQTEFEEAVLSLATRGKRGVLVEA
ncbi:MAG: hypothetical protein HYU39_01185 [Thaumarchaeota archaeon]|nr:hypothetical protein [Nitrososphaerota archaeon]